MAEKIIDPKNYSVAWFVGCCYRLHLAETDTRKEREED